MQRYKWIRPAVICVGMVLCFAASVAEGEILRIDAKIECEVQEYAGDEPFDFDSAFEEFRITDEELPIEVVSDLTKIDPNGALKAQARSISNFADPTRFPRNPNPQEFALEADCFSLDSRVRHEAFAAASETRLVRFSAEELLNPPGGKAAVRSRFFLGGAIVIWSADFSRDLTGVLAGLNVTVEQQRGEADPVTVFNASVTADGAADGQVEVDSTKVTVIFSPLQTLVESFPALFGGLEEAFAQFGNIQLIIIPDQDIGYEYPVDVGEEFLLTARLEVETRNLPDGVGVSAVFGRPFASLANIIDGVGKRSTGTPIQDTVNFLQRTKSASQSQPAFIFCAPLGIESLLGVFMLGMVALGRRRRARP